MVKCYKVAIYGNGRAVDTVLVMALSSLYKCTVMWSVVDVGRWEMLVCFARGNEPSFQEINSFVEQLCQKHGGSSWIDHLGRNVSKSLLSFIVRLENKGAMGSYPKALNFRVKEFKERQKERENRELIEQRIGADPSPELCLYYHENFSVLLSNYITCTHRLDLCAQRMRALEQRVRRMHEP